MCLRVALFFFHLASPGRLAAQNLNVFSTPASNAGLAEPRELMNGDTTTEIKTFFSSFRLKRPPTTTRRSPAGSVIYFTIDKFARLSAGTLLRGAFNWHDCIRLVKLINYGIA